MSRGRGRGQLTFNAELLGIGRGEAPSSVLTPPPTFPPRMHKPRPLLDNPKEDYFVNKGTEIVSHMHNSPFFLKPKGLLSENN